MSTSLYLITDAKLTGRETDVDWNRIINQLKGLNMSKISFVNVKNEVIQEEGNREFLVENDEGYPFNINFEGPFPMLPTLYSNIGLIYTIYNYSLLYNNIYRYDWFHSFRQDYIVKIIGGTAGIYLASCDKLAEFFRRDGFGEYSLRGYKKKNDKRAGKPCN